MPGIVQHKSAEATTQNVAVTLDSPVTEGNLVVAFVSFVGIGDSFSGFVEDSNPSPNFQLVASVNQSVFELLAYAGTALENGSYTLTAEFLANASHHLHVYEISGYDTVDRTGVSIQSSTKTPSVGVSLQTSAATELVLGAFLDASHIEVSFTPGAGFTTGETTGVNSFSVFSEYQTISQLGEPTASCSVPTADSFASIILTIYDSNSPTPPPPSGGTIFLGSVRVLGSAPAGQRVPYLGTVKVVDSAPSGASNPYLGSVVIGTPGPGNSNPSLGDVVVVNSIPAGDSDPFLGSVSEG